MNLSLLELKLILKKMILKLCKGDIITKGKDSIKTIDFIIENNIRSVLGNHEDKLLRYIKHQKLNKKILLFWIMMNKIL